MKADERRARQRRRKAALAGVPVLKRGVGGTARKAEKKKRAEPK